MKIKKTLKNILIGTMIASTLYISGCKGKENINENIKYPVIIGGQEYIEGGYKKPLCIRMEEPDTIFLNESKYKEISRTYNEVGLEGKFKVSYEGDRKYINGIIGLGKDEKNSFWDLFLPKITK